MKKFLLVLAVTVSFGAMAQPDSIKRVMSAPEINDNVNDGLTPRLVKDSMNQNADSTKNLIRELNDNSFENKRVKGSESQSTSTNKLKSGTSVVQMQDCIMMRKGKMMMVKNGVVTPMDPDMIMTNGTRVMSDGMILLRNGFQSKMKEGQHMDMTGNMMTMHNTKSLKTGSIAKPTTINSLSPSVN